jgi:hypothetical protein
VLALDDFVPRAEGFSASASSTTAPPAGEIIFT